ncbi:MAG: sigma-70 family RNA polymerase sigma factor [Paludisphaera borealis]|uniref:sigma-70 family RNA polymerase sigma factor n=1 Tax=Paludisphaera borealis TaxID=1387353 RepID=UPI00284B69D5|nr:sigma-70 family RNA polymerase sigma factor [Paludisphaera borealis]MDR3622297.1 sigma-70 family RNA polymerase sigma factor [Paludisphaera borealis]
MAGGSPERLQRDLTTLFQVGTAAGLTDRELIARISRASADDAEALFEVLVTRHGPMVLRVCRNVLNDPHDAEDAFQATFLVLVKQFRTIRKLDSIGSWLYGVAARVSARARVEAAKRRKREREHVQLAVVPAPDDEASRGLAIQEEVLRLPDRYRSVVVLCYWESLTHEQAATRLACPIGTVRSRVARARELLRRRLVHRGVADVDPAPAVLPLSSALVRSTVQATAKVTSGQAVSKVAAAHVAGLSLHVIRRMIMTKLGMIAVPTCLALVASINLGLGAQTPKRVHRDDKNRAETARAASKPRPASAPKDYIVDPPDLLIVEVLEALPGRPISGERLVRPDGKITLGFYGEVYVAGLTLMEVKEKVVLQLKKHLTNEALGLVADDGKEVLARDTDRVFVDVSAYNSKNYYVQGAFAAPGKLPSTGRDTVLDAVNYAGGLMPAADHAKVFLYRKDANGGPPKKLHVDIDEVLFGADNSTNFELQPGDRLVAMPKAEVDPNIDPTRSAAAGRSPNPDRLPTRDEWWSLTSEQKLDVMGIQIIEMRQQLKRIEEKLDKP